MKARSSPPRHLDLVLYLPVVGLFMSLTGCASLKEVKKSPGKGGIITLADGTDRGAKAEARLRMKETCGKKTPIILEEGDSVPGSSEYTAPHPWSLTPESAEAREWRIKYKCRKKKT